MQDRWLVLGCAGLAGAVAALAAMFALFVVAYGMNHPYRDGQPADGLLTGVRLVVAFAGPLVVAVGVAVLLAAREHRRRAALVGAGVFLAVLGGLLAWGFLIGPANRPT